MIIDCHGHYTTEPQQLHDFRKKQTEAANKHEHLGALGPQDHRRPDSREPGRRPTQVSARTRDRSHHLFAACGRHGPPHRRRAHQPGMDAALQRPDPSCLHALFAQFHRRLPVTAVARRVAGELRRRTRTLRDAVWLRRLQSQSRSVRWLLADQVACRSLVVPGLREDGRTRCAGDDPCQHVVQCLCAHDRCALHQRRHHRVHAVDHIGSVQGLSRR